MLVAVAFAQYYRHKVGVVGDCVPVLKTDPTPDECELLFRPQVVFLVCINLGVSGVLINQGVLISECSLRGVPLYCKAIMPQLVLGKRNVCGHIVRPSPVISS